MKCGKPYKKKTPVVTKSSNKDNAPPSNPDHQDVPQSLKQFMKLKKQAIAESKETKQKKQKSNKRNSEVSQSDIKNGEKNPSKVNSNPNSTSNNKTAAKNVRPDKLYGLRKKKHLKLQKLKEKRKLKKQQQKEKVTVDEEETMKDLRKEEIKFGEVVHRPPQISVLPRKVTKTGFENRPGRKDDLLLKSLLKNTSYGKESRAPLTDKRKNLPVSDQRQLEVERQKAVLAYKNMKQKQSRVKNLYN